MATQEGTQNPVYLTVTTGIGIAGDLSYDMLKSALEDASFETKLAALVPGAQLWVVKNIGNTIEIGLGLANNLAVRSRPCKT
ncbi:hypothetical protein GALL_548280 [mine drainage metagenome]|uniref:Uncharacterized protein n=1 Tax=mine drainage metagenome TaxID=410659 RepID=A0A1J5P770_9ZZZZ